MTSRAQIDPRSTVDPDEVARFSALAQEWWDPRGKMGSLHKFNPVRLGFIKDTACRHFARDGKGIDALAGLRILDIGCGGGLLSEPLARLGAEVVGADPSETNIAVARLHASDQGLAVDYRAATAEALADAGERFDIVLAMEVVEHVADLSLFVNRCAEMVKTGRADDRGHPQPHAQELCAGDRGRGVRSGLAAARHPPMEQVRHAGRAAGRASSGPGSV